jgi:hypothetical protein
LGIPWWKRCGVRTLADRRGIRLLSVNTNHRLATRVSSLAWPTFVPQVCPCMCLASATCLLSCSTLLLVSSHKSTLALLRFVTWCVCCDVRSQLGCHACWMVVPWVGSPTSRMATPSCNLAISPWSSPHHEYMLRSALKHALSLRLPRSTISWSSHPLYTNNTYLGMGMPFLNYLNLALRSSSFALPLWSSEI